MWNFRKKQDAAESPVRQPLEACHCIEGCMKRYLGWDSCPEGQRYFCLVDAGLVPIPASTIAGHEAGPMIEDRALAGDR